jgi:serine/threonine-protein kinase
MTTYFLKRDLTAMNISYIPARPARLVIIAVIAPVLFFSLFLANAQARNYFGAIAYSTTSQAYGYSYDYPSRKGAEARALAECEERGGGCEIVIWFRNACGALATAGNGARGWAWDKTRGEAEAAAMDYCRKHGGQDCAVLCWSCTTRK